jgi:hypothetical protein
MPHKRKPQKKNLHQTSESSSIVDYIKQPFVSLQGFFNSKSLKDDKLVIVDRLSRLFSRIELAPFVILSFLEKVKAEEIQNLYALEPASGVHYLIQEADFPSLQSDLIKYCNTIFFDVAQAMYDLDSAAQCVSQDNQLGPLVNISVEVGKNLTLTFMNCLNSVLKPECDEYFSHHQQEEDSIPKWGLAQTLTVAFCGAVALCACFYFCCYNKNRCSSSSGSNYNSNYSYNSGGTMVVVNDNYESHHSSSNNDQGSSVVWHHY